MSETTDKTPEKLPAWLALPKRLEGASNAELLARYDHLSEIKLAGETRVGRHPSDFNNPKDVEPDPLVREVLDAGLSNIVREMAAIMHALHQRPGGFRAMFDAEEPEDSSEPVVATIKDQTH